MRYERTAGLRLFDRLDHPVKLALWCAINGLPVPEAEDAKAENAEHTQGGGSTADDDEDGRKAYDVELKVHFSGDRVFVLGILGNMIDLICRSQQTCHRMAKDEIVRLEWPVGQDAAEN